MIAQVLAGGGDYDLLWSLIGAVRNGFPVENLRPLLVSENPRITATAAYLAYELGSDMRPVLDDLVPLADHPGAQWRSDIIIAMTDCVGPDNLDALSRIMLAFDDPEPFVHRAAMNFVIGAESLTLVHAVGEAAARFPGSPFETILSMLLGKRTRLDTRSLRMTDARLKQFIDHDEPVVRRFGVGLAARPTYVVDIGRLEIARGCRDEEGLRVIDFTMHRPRAELARLEYQKSGSQRGERWRTRQRSRDSQG
ncbi:hypothetical protein [Oricola sp.]|uniref:hypothetical protein n=1 Tax=Oricola sp. TaxID=1979950 RepID=UPI0025F9CB2C|nr:hypothetical protein [Oricola sp.]MCI5075540.1 hypothetical protein [Oricola sp.]